MTDVSPVPKNDWSWQKADKVRYGQVMRGVSAVCNTQCHSTGVSPRESAQFPTGVKDVRSSALLVKATCMSLCSGQLRGLVVFR